MPALLPFLGSMFSKVMNFSYMLSMLTSLKYQAQEVLNSVSGTNKMAKKLEKYSNDEELSTLAAKKEETMQCIGRVQNIIKELNAYINRVNELQAIYNTTGNTAQIMEEMKVLQENIKKKKEELFTERAKALQLAKEYNAFLETLQSKYKYPGGKANARR